MDIQRGILATRRIRLMGAIIDSMVTMLVMAPLLFVTGGFAADATFSIGQTILSFILGVIVFVVLHGYFLATKGQTIGKAVVGTKIVNELGDKPPFGRLLGLRYLVPGLVYSVPCIGSLIAVINVLFIFREDRRCLHDHLAGTYVVNV